VLSGYNATIFAYGQTGSGKTFTMFGPHWDDNIGGVSGQNTMMSSSFKNDNPFLSDQQMYGIIPRSIEHLFLGLQQIQDQNPG
jgi:hypothetical protein